MIIIKKTNSDDKDFQALVKELDLELKVRDGTDHEFYAPMNKTDKIKHALVAYNIEEPVGCGALREYDPGVMEIKRMFVPVARRGQGIASAILSALETWCAELECKKCILETGKKEPEAIQLYKKNNYNIISNYGPYQNVENSVCFEKVL